MRHRLWGRMYGGVQNLGIQSSGVLMLLFFFFFSPSAGMELRVLYVQGKVFYH